VRSVGAVWSPKPKPILNLKIHSCPILYKKYRHDQSRRQAGCVNEAALERKEEVTRDLGEIKGRDIAASHRISKSPSRSTNFTILSIQTTQVFNILTTPLTTQIQPTALTSFSKTFSKEPVPSVPAQIDNAQCYGDRLSFPGFPWSCSLAQINHVLEKSETTSTWRLQ